MNYYKSELQKLGSVKKGASIQIVCEGKKTNYIALNKDSLKALKEFLNTIEL